MVKGEINTSSVVKGGIDVFTGVDKIMVDELDAGRRRAGARIRGREGIKRILSKLSDVSRQGRLMPIFWCALETVADATMSGKSLQLGGKIINTPGRGKRL